MRIYNRVFPSFPDSEEQPRPATPCYLSYNDNAPHWSYALHDHEDFYEYAFVVTGEGLVNLEMNSQHISAGDIVIMPPHILHYYSAPQITNPLRYYSLRYRPNENSFLCDIRSAPIIIHAEPYLDLMRSSFQLLDESILIGGKKGSDLTLSASMTLYHLSEMLFSNRSMTVPLKGGTYAHEILLYLSEHYAEPITLASLSEHFNISPSQLGNIFRNAYHISPIAHLINRRIANATDFLLQSDLSVKQVAQAVGYEDTTHFSHLFVERIGCTPGEFRRRYSI